MAPVAALRSQMVTARVAGGGLTEPLRFQLPDGSRSFTIVVQGEADAVYALASLKVNQQELVRADAQALAAGLASAYQEESLAASSDSLLQSARLGTFTFLYPYTPVQPPPVGSIEFRVVASRETRALKVMVLAPAEDGADVLHVHLIFVGAHHGIGEQFLAHTRAVLAQAKLRLQVDAMHTLSPSPYAAIPEVAAPFEAPSGALAQLASLSEIRHADAALNVFVVERLPKGHAGVSLGTPGPPLPSSYYFGVVVKEADPETLGRTLAHELAHYLGLRHVRTITPSGLTLVDQLDDTEPDQANLMEHGTRLTAGQAYVLSRSALLRTQ